MKYRRITQEHYCCVPACLQMICIRQGIINYTQEKIGYELGLTVPPGAAIYFNKVRIGNEPSSGYGTQVSKEDYSINNFFEKYNIPLTYEHHYIDDYDKAKKFLIDNKNHDIMTCFHRGTLDEMPERDWGHVALIDHVSEDAIVLYETDPTLEDNFTASLRRLIKAIKKHGKENSAGFWLIKKID